MRIVKPMAQKAGRMRVQVQVDAAGVAAVFGDRVVGCEIGISAAVGVEMMAGGCVCVGDVFSGDSTGESSGILVAGGLGASAIVLGEISAQWGRTRHCGRSVDSMGTARSATMARSQTRWRLDAESRFSISTAMEARRRRAVPLMAESASVGLETFVMPVSI